MKELKQYHLSEYIQCLEDSGLLAKGAPEILGDPLIKGLTYNSKEVS